MRTSAPMRVPCQPPPLPAQRSVRPAWRPLISGLRVHISSLRNEAELLDRLRQGCRVVLYSGFSPNHLPQPGQEYARPYAATAEQQAPMFKYLPMEEQLEKYRQKNCPDSPSRLTSVYTTTSPEDAARFGEVFELEVALRPQALSSGRLPVRWLDRNTFDYLIENQRWLLRAGRGQFQKMLDDYWTGSGSHRGISDILLDPLQVEIRVMGFVRHAARG